MPNTRRSEPIQLELDIPIDTSFQGTREVPVSSEDTSNVFTRQQVIEMLDELRDDVARQFKSLGSNAMWGNTASASRLFGLANKYESCKGKLPKR